MMHADTALRRWTTFGVAILVAACGGGGSSDGVTAGIDRGGIVTATGSITGFGSVHVNGVHYVTTGATITLDDNPGSESELRVGQVVRIEGRLDPDGDVVAPLGVVADDLIGEAWPDAQADDGQQQDQRRDDGGDDGGRYGRLHRAAPVLLVLVTS